MARHSPGVAIAAGPGWTDVFRSTVAGGTDGPPLKSALLTMRGANDAEILIKNPAQSADDSQYGLLDGGTNESYPLNFGGTPIHWVQARGVGGVTSVGIDPTTLERYDAVSTS